MHKEARWSAEGPRTDQSAHVLRLARSEAAARCRSLGPRRAAHRQAAGAVAAAAEGGSASRHARPRGEDPEVLEERQPRPDQEGQSSATSASPPAARSSAPSAHSVKKSRRLSAEVRAREQRAPSGRISCSNAAAEAEPLPARPRHQDCTQVPSRCSGTTQARCESARPRRESRARSAQQRRAARLQASERRRARPPLGAGSTRRRRAATARRQQQPPTSGSVAALRIR